MNITSDEERLLRYLRCLPITRRELLMHQIAQEAVESRILPDLRVNCYAAFMPEPPDGGIRGDIRDGYSTDHWLYCAMDATGDAEDTLLGSSNRDKETYFPVMREVLQREAKRQGHLYLDTSDEALDRLLTEWRFNIVRACEGTSSRTESKDE
jgi:hypothetical protein